MSRSPIPNLNDQVPRKQHIFQTMDFVTLRLFQKKGAYTQCPELSKRNALSNLSCFSCESFDWESRSTVQNVSRIREMCILQRV